MSIRVQTGTRATLANAVTMRNLTHGSLFSGIGGFDLAARWMGWENVFHCEREPFAQKVLAHHFPESKLYEDVTTFDGRKYSGSIDVISGGFPCQPFSVAGKRQGKEDERYLWGEMLRIIREIKPRYVVGENVYGLVNWNSGEVFEDVCSSLEAEGYEVESYVLPASAIGAPHQRYRIFFVAYSDGCTNLRISGEDESESKKERISKRNKVRKPNESSSIQRDAADCNNGRTKHEVQARRNEFTRGSWSNFPTQSPIFGGDDGIPSRLDDISVPRWRTESIKAYGNAVVPPLIYEIFTAIQAFDDAQGR